MRILKQHKWLRLIQYKNKYYVQVKYFFKWRLVTFGPYYPMTVGLTKFSSLSILNVEYEKCLAKPKRYTVKGVQEKGFSINKIVAYLLNIFTKEGRKRNYFNSALSNLKKSHRNKRSVSLKKSFDNFTKKVKSYAIDLWKRRKIIKRFKAKRFAIKMVKFWQSGPKKSNYELMRLAEVHGVKERLEKAGVRTNWYQMKFLN